ncbi:sulfhydryl oxidase 2 isoform X1 [Hyalella azteca]|uniref:Sulfhydryl oxidase n=1 Tax=Hyalella azteca TaxID=294128 RepID=A0A8B7NR65_HYAAZ|nr:sulfhydryl oxidase 2 isoform X1 [Hyalella azteca]
MSIIGILCFTLFVGYVNVAGNPLAADRTTKSLYNETDLVTVLDLNNFYETLLGKDHAWLVQFYSSYCGHCIAFAPQFKIFAKNISDWDHTVKLAVLNCADEANTGLCRQYEVFSYPTLSFLPRNLSKGDVGVQLQTERTVPSLRAGLVQYLAAQQAAGNGSASWVNLQPFSGSEQELLSSAGLDVSDGVVFVGREGYAQQLIMDLGHFRNDIILQMMKRDAGFLKDMELPPESALPVVVLVHRTQQPRVIEKNFTSLQEIIDEVIEALGLDVQKLPSKKLHVEENAMREGEAGVGAGVNDGLVKPSSDKPTIFLVDVENAVGIALRQEVALHRIISGERLAALKNFLSVLTKYLPARPKVHAFLSDLNKSIGAYENSMTYDEYSAAMQRAEQHGMLPPQQAWIGCRGSQPHLRGFPCGLWTTFHLLLSSAASIVPRDPTPDPLETLSAIHGFVKYFFSCSECSQHFQEMYIEDAAASVESLDAAVLWLWKAHNKVNKRTAGTQSEDPLVPKVQYPPRSSCPQCWTRPGSRESFRPLRVLQYLNAVYSKDALSLKGISRASRMQDLDKVYMGKNTQDSRLLIDQRDFDASFGGDANVVKVVDDDAQSESKESIFRSLSEISTCMLLYSITTLTVGLLYLLYRMRQRIRRKKFIEMYKNPLNA